MPSLVKTNASLASGGIALLEQSVGTRSSTELVISARFVALKAYMEKWAALLQPGSLSPLPLSYAGNALSATNEPRLNEVSVSIQAGLVYFDCQFSAQRALTVSDINDPTAPINISSSIALQSFSGAKEFSAADEFYTRTTEFDYYAENKTLTASSKQIVQVARDQLTVASLFFGLPFNVRGNTQLAVTSLRGQTVLVASAQRPTGVAIDTFSIVPSVVYSYGEDKNESGSTIYRITASLRLLQEAESSPQGSNPLDDLV